MPGRELDELVRQLALIVHERGGLWEPLAAATVVYSDRTETHGPWPADACSQLLTQWFDAHLIGIVRVGQQPNHWGMGILANDGNHPTLFGDYRYGSISERILFATKPGGESSDFVIALAGDLVFRDQNAKLARGDQAFQGVLAAYWERGQNQVGVFSTLRRQRTDRASAPFSTYTDAIDAAASRTPAHPPCARHTPRRERPPPAPAPAAG